MNAYIPPPVVVVDRAMRSRSAYRPRFQIQRPPAPRPRTFQQALHARGQFGAKLLISDVRDLRRRWAAPHGLNCRAFCRAEVARLQAAGVRVAWITIQQVVKRESWTWVA